MPLLESYGQRPANSATSSGFPLQPNRRHSEQYSDLARIAMLSNNSTTPSPSESEKSETTDSHDYGSHAYLNSLMPPPKTHFGRLGERQASKSGTHNANGMNAWGAALTDTPCPSTPSSPQIQPRHDNRSSISGASTPGKIRATTLDIPGLTKSKASPDGRISRRDVGAKLVIIMVGLPARGKSYLVKKIARYLNWQQHPTRIFNVGDRRRVAAGSGQTIPDLSIDTVLKESVRKMSVTTAAPESLVDMATILPPPALTAEILVNGEPNNSAPSAPATPEPSPVSPSPPSRNGMDSIRLPSSKVFDQSANFFDPENAEGKRIREQVAHETLDELLKYVLEDGGSVGIFDATNHTRERRMSIMKHIRERDVNINVLFLESRCQDKNLLQANMRLKLSGPDYKNRDPVEALKDFQNRVRQYEKKYQMLDEFEEENNLSYCSMIDVGRKMISHKVNGFLSIQTVTYLMNFNLAPRQIWLTRHGESLDNVNGKIGGDSELSPLGWRYAKALEQFIIKQRAAWEAYQIEKQASTHFPPRPGDTTPPNPEHSAQLHEERNFCVWTSMLKRSFQTSVFFDDEAFDIKQMRMLDELNAGNMEGMTYEEIKDKFPKEYDLRKQDKLQYRYPGPGGEGYLDIISRLRKVILEIERMTDHVLIIGHRSIVRVLLAYFVGLGQEAISDLDVPLGVVYSLEPRPYGVDFKVYRWNGNDDFDFVPDYHLRREPSDQ